MLVTLHLNLFSDNPTRNVEFIVRDIEDGPLNKAKITVKKGDQSWELETDINGKASLLAKDSKINLGT